MAMRDGRTVLGYQDHYLVDGGKARIILHAFVTPGDVSESQVLVDQLRRTLFRRKLRPKRLIADAKYGTGENIRAMEEQGIRAYHAVARSGTSPRPTITTPRSPTTPSRMSIAARRAGAQVPAW